MLWQRFWVLLAMAGAPATPLPAPAVLVPPPASAPSVQTPAEDDTVLIPPPEAERLDEASGYLEVSNPAFPVLKPERVPRPPHPIGPEELAPYFPSGPLAE